MNREKTKVPKISHFGPCFSFEIHGSSNHKKTHTYVGKKKTLVDFPFGKIDFFPILKLKPIWVI
jgi:hypothetical protein